MAFVRFMALGLVVLGVIYISVSLYVRSVTREQLEKTYDANPVAGQSRGAYVEEGMRAYHNSLRPKLLGLIFVVPPVIVAVIIYVVNVN